MLKLNRNEMSAVKLVAKKREQLEKQRAKLNDKYEKLKAENERALNELDEQIKSWETPIMCMTGGLTSKEVLENYNEETGEINVSTETGEVNEPTVETPTQEETFNPDATFNY